jgi:hypothetical protein
MRESSNSPIVYPKVTIGAEVLTVKIGLLAELIISRAGLSFPELITALRPQNRDPRKMALVFEFFAAAVAINYQEAGQPVPTSDQWAAKIDAAGGDLDGNQKLLVAIFSALTEAVLKRWPELRAVPETPAPSPTDTEVVKN